MDSIFLGKCQEVWVFGDKITDGMATELGIAKRRGQKIRYFSGEVKENA